jgi:hypothetical protein
VIAAFIGLSVHSFAAEKSSEHLPSTFPLIQKQHASQTANLPKSVLAYLSLDASDKVLSFCKGNFRTEQLEEYSVVVFNLKSLFLSLYVVPSLPNSGGEKMDVASVHTGYTKLSNIDSLMTSYTALQCRSFSDSKTWNQELSGSEKYGVDGNLVFVSDLNTMCLAEDDAGSTCYQYDSIQKKFIQIGGWRT